MTASDTSTCVVGTHYDADHLDGLLPIINDRSITITEAWLPPVANDTQPHATDDTLLDEHLLARQLATPEGHRILARYLDEKFQVCQFLRGAEEPLNARHIQRADREELENLKAMFAEYRAEALRELNADRWTHADENAFVPARLGSLLKRSRVSRWSRNGDWWLRDRRFADLRVDQIMQLARPVRAHSVAAYNLAGIRKSAACDAINAISLAKVVAALGDREIPIRCRIIPDGSPQRFVWAAGRFVPGGRAQGPVINLLGPSESLVRKHWDRLPIGAYAFLALESLLRIRSITPSNQLSYIACVNLQGQGILVSGDAGCVDFRPGQAQPYYETLLSALQPLHVVQVAHHAGCNAHFYRVLEAAKYPTGAKESFLLVSHATQDVHRPSREFGQFTGAVRRDTDTVKILFTTQPRQEKVHDFADLVHPAVGAIGEAGDVRLEYQDSAWTVTKHAINLASDRTNSWSVALAKSMTVKGPVQLVKGDGKRSQP